MENNTLSHHGITGMKWGIRRYQSKDGTLTPAGKKRYAKEMEKLKAEKKVLANKKRTQAKIEKLKSMRKSIDEEKANLEGDSKKKKTATAAEQPPKRKVKDLSDEELAQKINRMRMEDTYASLVNARHPQVEKGKSFAGEFMDGAVKPAAVSAGKTLLTNLLVNKGSKLLGLDKKEVEDGFGALKKEVDTLKLKKEKALAEDFFANRDKKAKANKETETKKEEPKSEEKSTVNHYTIYPGDSNKSSGSSKKSNRVVYEADWTDVSDSSYTSSGSNYVSGLLSSNSSSRFTSSDVNNGRNYIAGLLPPPRKRDDD